MRAGDLRAYATLFWVGKAAIIGYVTVSITQRGGTGGVRSPDAVSEKRLLSGAQGINTSACCSLHVLAPYMETIVGACVPAGCQCCPSHISCNS